MTTVLVTQFIPPNGMKKYSFLELSNAKEDKYNQILRSGCRITVEVLQTGITSVTIEEPNLGDFVIELVSMGDSVEKAIESVVNSFNEEEFESWKKTIE